MEDDIKQEDRGGWEHSQQLRAVVGEGVNQVIQAIVARFSGRTVHSVRRRSSTWPGVNDVEPEPIGCLEPPANWSERHMPCNWTTSAWPGRRDATGMRSEMRWTALGCRGEQGINR